MIVKRARPYLIGIIAGPAILFGVYKLLIYFLIGSGQSDSGMAVGISMSPLEFSIAIILLIGIIVFFTWLTQQLFRKSS